MSVVTWDVWRIRLPYVASNLLVSEIGAAGLLAVCFPFAGEEALSSSRAVIKYLEGTTQQAIASYFFG